MYYIFGNVVTNGQIFKHTFVEVDGGEITFVGQRPRYEGVKVYNEEENYICPGFIDVHIHGVDGLDFMDLEEKDRFHIMAERLAQYGVTSFLATSRTASVEDILSFLQDAKTFSDDNDQLLGVHLEGPWISEVYKGAQPTEHILNFSEESFTKLIQQHYSLIKKLTLAPELFMKYKTWVSECHRLGIQVSMGHTNATFDQASQMIAHGIQHMTHTFNAMSPVHHRNPGVAAAALYYPNVFTEIISDGLHIHPEIIKLLYRIKSKDYMVIVSDNTGYNHLEDGDYEFRGKKLHKKGDGIYLSQGNLAGSCMMLIDMVKVLVNDCGIPFAETIDMMTRTPIKTLNIDERVGVIEKGHRANLNIIDGAYNLKYTILKGKVVT